ncbi:hypothetical protein [Ruminococcus sp.]|uniref:hypothetical protein n=1 Tax=Ruminococcus sp. TaxID=41978 RepID=UPI001B45AFCB|nr:hypothetical protein [Ruminococcus sp.]MBP5432875.1 hypothetical protein [Ruminococcus sp.]
MLKRELEILLKDAELGIKDLEQENANLKARNEALTRFIAATALNLTGEVEPIKKAVADIRAALTSRTDDESTIQKITEIINAVPKVNPE